jgi:hypothetical protein
MPRALHKPNDFRNDQYRRGSSNSKESAQQESRLSNILGRKAGGSSRAFTSAIVLILLFLVGCFVWRIMQTYV